jgi:hypothetical protein
LVFAGSKGGFCGDVDVVEVVVDVVEVVVVIVVVSGTGGASQHKLSVGLIMLSMPSFFTQPGVTQVYVLHVGAASQQSASVGVAT